MEEDMVVTEVLIKAIIQIIKDTVKDAETKDVLVEKIKALITKD